MEKVLISKDSCLIIIYSIFLPILLFLILKTIKLEDKQKRKKNASIIALIGIFIFASPLEKYIDMLPIKTPNVEQAFKFNYGNKYKLIFKKRYKNTYFTMGKFTDINRPFDEYSCYYKTKNGWRTLIQQSDRRTGRINYDGYDIYYCNNQRDNITGVFIAKTVHEYRFNNHKKIEDKYGTKFNFIVGENKELITYNDSKSYVSFAVVKHNISDDYYIKIDDEIIKFK